MATLEWAQVRGRELIKSEVVVLDESSSAEFLELGLSGATIGASVFLNVGIERHGIPVIASVVIDDSEAEIDLVIAATLMHGSAPFLESRHLAFELGFFCIGNGEGEQRKSFFFAVEARRGGSSGPVPSANLAQWRGLARPFRHPSEPMGRKRRVFRQR